MEKKIRYGIVGCGAISAIHAKALENSANSVLVAVSDVNSAAAESLGKEYSVDCYTDYLQLLSRADIDVVSICTPSGIRGSIAEEAARHGKNILAEKPLEITLDKIDSMIRAANENHVELGAVLNHRYKNDVRKLYDLIQAGTLGRLFMGDAYIKWLRTAEYYRSGAWRGSWALDGGGALMNQSIHTIDLLQWFMGPAEKIFGFTGRQLHHKIETEDTAVAVVKFLSGALGVIEGSTAIYPGFEARIEISGENGTAILENGKLAYLKTRDGGDTAVQKGDEKTAGGASDPMDIGFEDHMRLIEDFSNCIAQGTHFWIDGAEARKAIEIILSVYRSDTAQEVTCLTSTVKDA